MENGAVGETHDGRTRRKSTVYPRKLMFLGGLGFFGGELWILEVNIEEFCLFCQNFMQKLKVFWMFDV
jgi:hypothetical protein